MRRVSSRQRLVSWDAFDATARSDESDSDYETCHSGGGFLFSSSQFISPSDDLEDSLFYTDLGNTEESYFDAAIPATVAISRKDSSPSLVPCMAATPNSKKRDASEMKKTVSFSNLLAQSIEIPPPLTTTSVTAVSPILHKPAIVPATSEEVQAPQSTTTTTPIAPFLDLNQDVQIHILSFLPLHSLRSTLLTCRTLHSLLAGSTKNQMTDTARNALWIPLLRRHFPSLSLSENARVTFTNRDLDNDGNGTEAPSMEYGGLLSRAHPTPTASQIHSKFWMQPDHDYDGEEEDGYESEDVELAQERSGVVLARARRRIRRRRRETLRRRNANNELDPNTTTHNLLLGMSHLEVERIMQSRRERLNDSENNCFVTYDTEMVIPGSEKKQEKEYVSRMVQVVQFNGRVGVGDRSIQSDFPFPKPLERFPSFVPDSMIKRNAESDSSEDESGNQTQDNDGDENSDDELYYPQISHSRFPSLARCSRSRNSHRRRRKNRGGSNTGTFSSSPTTSFFKMLRRSRNRHQTQVRRIISVSSPARNTIPFVSPFISKENAAMMATKRYHEIDLTPRMVAYFEVSILEQQEEKQLGHGSNNHSNQTRQGLVGDFTPRPTFRPMRRAASDCVAVGLSHGHYEVKGRMPGWDCNSYGYHGDDGGIFHSKGDMLRVYGPKYGKGDTVGCGVNYETGGIFFTLNGDFLGYAWCNESIIYKGKTDLYPTIGVDTSCPLACNFGNSRPFVFDFAKFVASNGSMPVQV